LNNIPRERRTASISPNHAMILPHDANQERMEFSGTTVSGKHKDRVPSSEKHMRKVITVAVVLMISCITSNIRAETPAQELTAGPPKLNLTLEQRYIIKEIIKDMRIERAPAKILAVGDQIPHNIRLQPIPSDVVQKAPQIKTYKFFMAGRQIIIVDPRDNKVAEIVSLGSD